MEQLNQFKDEILALKDPKGQTMWALSIDEAMENPGLFTDTIKPLIEPLTDGSVDDGDLDQVATTIWDRFADAFIAGEKAYIQHIMALLPLYQHLLFATREEWVAYHRITVEATLGSSFMLRMLAGLNSSLADEGEPLEDAAHTPPGG